MKFDKLNRNEKWDWSVKAEMKQLDDYCCFIDAGVYGKDSPPMTTRRYELILCLMSNMMDETRQGLLVVVISPMFLRGVSTPESCLYKEYAWLPSSLNSMVWNCELPK
jgi:hypothetical protein